MRFTHPPEVLSRLPESVRHLASDVSPRRLERVLRLAAERLPGVVVAAEAVHRRHNTSAILRSAEAFGVHEAHLVARRFRAARGAAKGAERWLKLSVQPDVHALMAALRPRGFRLYVADIDPGAVPPEQVPVDRPVALLFGSELAGVSPEARDAADGVVSIPTVGVTQSLNVSAAAAIVLRAVCMRARAAGPVGLPPPARDAFIERFVRRESARKKSVDHMLRG